MAKTNRRRRFPLVNKSRQYRFLAMNLIYSFILVAYLAVALFIPDILQMQNESLSLDIRAAAADRILHLHAKVWPAIIILVCFIAVHSFWIFHRIAGPLYRLGKSYSRIQKGELGFSVTLRKRDYLHWEANEFNHMTETLSEKIKSIQSSSADALNKLMEFEKSEQKQNKLDQLDRENLSFVHKQLDAINDAVNYFKIQI